MLFMSNILWAKRKLAGYDGLASHQKEIKGGKNGE